jgi:hypothetical protein
MREFLLELYLEHGEREFECYKYLGNGVNEFIAVNYSGYPYKYKLTHKALEYIKNLDNP